MRAAGALADGAQAAGTRAGTDDRFTLDWALCDGHGLCADVVPELIQRGPDGHPLVLTATIPPYLAARAKAAVRRCPALALRVGTN